MGDSLSRGYERQEQLDYSRDCKRAKELLVYLVDNDLHGIMCRSMLNAVRILRDESQKCSASRELFGTIDKLVSIISEDSLIDRKRRARLANEN